MRRRKGISRREFIERSVGGAAAGIAATGLVRAAATSGGGGRPLAASDKVTMGVIGAGIRGLENMETLLKAGGNVAMVCDLYDGHLRRAQEIQAHTPTTKDYREVLDRKDIDAVMIATADHWHQPIALAAMRAGKDVYCEKPLTLTVAEAVAMMKVSKDTGKIIQTGSQQRSAKEFRQACELVRNGALGTLKQVKVGLPGPNWVDRAKKPVPDSDPPAALDYDFWLGPAPERHYNANRVHYLFRFFWDYSGGQLTNWGAHHLDIAQWGLGMDESGPVAVEAKARYHKDGWYEVPQWCEIVYKYANGTTVVCGQSERGGATFEVACASAPFFSRSSFCTPRTV